MPVLYACLVNQRKTVVLEGFYRDSKISYKKNILDYYSAFELYATKEINLDEKLNLVYKQLDVITICIVTTKNVDLYESGQFLEKFSNCIKNEWAAAGGSANQTEDLEAMLSPFNSRDASTKFAKHNNDVSKFVNNWNDDPSNRSKTAVLFSELESTKNLYMENLEESLKRG